jgi:RsiW-degrading membrane proteinase PrsW (M82 family)
MEFLILLAVLPGFIICFLIYKADRVEPEPKIELLKAFLLGIVAVILTLVISLIFNIDKVDTNFNNWLDVFLYSFIGISLVEELSKWICSYLFLRNNKNYDYLFDGVVYTVFVALGFATVENILYTLSGGLVTGIIRAITTVPAHAFFGISSGYFITLSKQEKIFGSPRLRKLYLFLSFFVPFLLHGFYDFCLLTENTILFIVYLIFVVCLYSISIYQVKQLMEHDEPFIE